MTFVSGRSRLLHRRKSRARDMVLLNYHAIVIRRTQSCGFVSLQNGPRTSVYRNSISELGISLSGISTEGTVLWRNASLGASDQLECARSFRAFWTHRMGVYVNRADDTLSGHVVHYVPLQVHSDTMCRAEGSSRTGSEKVRESQFLQGRT